MDIKVESDQLELIQTGWFQTNANEDIRLKIPPLTIVFRFIKSADAEKDKPAITRTEADPANLILTLVVEGNIPPGPFGHLTTRPWQVGTVNGTPIFLSYKIDKTSAKEPQAEIIYSIYKMHSVPAPSQPVSGQTTSEGGK